MGTIRGACFSAVAAAATGILLSSFSFSAETGQLMLASTRVMFVDACSRAPVGVTSKKGGAILRVELSGLATGLPLDVSVSIQPDETLPVGKKSENVDFTFKKTARRMKTTAVAFEKHVRFNHKHPIWNVHVDWIQASPPGTIDAKSGSGAASIYVLRDPAETFYRVQGSAICAWETPLSISSEYYFNGSGETMHIQHLTSDLDGEYFLRGLNLGIIPDLTASTAIVSATNTGVEPNLMQSPLITDALHSNFGWLFSSWRTIYATNARNVLMQSWLLGHGEGGFFGDRVAFERYPVVEFALDESGKCDAWKAVRKGNMEAGRIVTDFYSVPRDLSGDPALSAAHMERMRPSVDTCRAHGINAGNLKYQVNPASGGERGMLFFYPEAVL